MAKFDFRRDVWEPLRSHVSVDDGLPVYSCGHWTIDKLFVLGHYLSFVTRTMHGKGFVSLNYVDLFCGPGVDVVRGMNVNPRHPGSPLLAAAAPRGFDRIMLADQTTENVEAADQRVRGMATGSELLTWDDDANVAISDIARAIPDHSLTVAFIDPYSVGGVKMATISRLAARGAVDLLVLFADRMDAGRNLSYYASGQSAKLDEFLGEGADWRTRYGRLDSHQPDRVREFLSNVFQDQLGKLGYHCFRTKAIRSERGPLYRLIYASKHEAGLNFWDTASKYDRDGSRGLF